MEVWRIDVRKHSLSREPVPESWERLGGRGLIARILVDEVSRTCDPLGRHNKLIFAPGLLVGHMLSSCDRISAGGKSPLTGGVKESNAGGSTGLQISRLGLKALILEDQPETAGWWLLYLSKDGARFEPAGELAGLGAYACARALRERFGEKVAISLIGPGGENQLLAAGILNLDKDGVPSRINGRGGLGALMGSKGLKAIIFDAGDGQKPPIADPAAFKAAQKSFTKSVIEHPQSGVYRDFGTAAIANLCNTLGGLPTRGFSAGEFEGVETLSGEHLRQTVLQHGGDAQPTHACMAGCTIQCSNVFAGEDGKEIVSPVEYETIALMGSNLGLDNLDDIARLNWEVNDLGIDSIDTGAALGVAAQAGLMQFGDAGRALALLDEVRRNTPLGRVIGSGAALAGKVLGVRRVPVVKNQAISGYDPRAIKGTGVTYATTPQGADHTAGLTIRARIDHLNPEGQAKVSRNAQLNMAGYDTLGACIFAGFGFGAAPETVRDLLNARYGWQVGDGILQELGRETIRLEREFNRQAGFTAADDRLPEWMTEEALAPTGSVFDVPAGDLDGVFE
ncbi:aldehyde:ferredoxin oxidoreductase [Longilinea arvoryzae]|uniref:Aldehyde:ferredoxin oxidoreductase n=1 Tax=Longilinea arvoryzae TaxID=360412 RepID=A0A0S7BJJ4_9CHLR|nr:aldehyde ferredoxin oxidoreductase C-terminal domain-containing protein [Longilinea arvoryzae]GAP15817.1 aldehyde:ferredoxin oxidoreductase [Longilinea arvoryzae]